MIQTDAVLEEVKQLVPYFKNLLLTRIKNKLIPMESNYAPVNEEQTPFMNQQGKQYKPDRFRYLGLTSRICNLVLFVLISSSSDLSFYGFSLVATQIQDVRTSLLRFSKCLLVFNIGTLLLISYPLLSFPFPLVSLLALVQSRSRQPLESV